MATREAKLIAYLHEKTGLPVSNTKEAGRTSEEYILVQRTNGSRVNKIDSRTYAIQSISSISKLRAAQIDVGGVKGVLRGRAVYLQVRSQLRLRLHGRQH